jgi:hypothetical protein
LEGFFRVWFSFAFQLVLSFYVLGANLASVNLTVLGLVAVAVWNMWGLASVVNSVSFRAGEVFIRLFLIWHLLLPGAIQWSTGRFFWKPDSYSDDDATLALVIILVAVLGLELGFRFFFEIETPRRQRQRRPLLSNLNIVIFIIISFVSLYVPVSQFGTDFIFATRGTIDNLIELTTTEQYEHIIFLSVPQAMAFCVFALALLNMVTLRHVRQETVFTYVGCFVLFIPYIVLNFPTSMARFETMGQLIILIYIMFFFKTRYLNIVYIFAYPLALYTLLPFLGIFSRYEEFQFDAAYKAFVSGISDSVYAGDYSDFEMTMMTAQYVASEGIRMGQQIFTTLLFFLPRSIFTFRADPTNYLLADFFKFEFRNIASPFFAEFYIDFWFPGAFVGSFLFAFAAKNLQRRIQPNYGFYALPPMALLAYLPIILRGSFLAVIGFVLVYPASFMLLLVIHRIVVADSDGAARGALGLRGRRRVERVSVWPERP